MRNREIASGIAAALLVLSLSGCASNVDRSKIEGKSLAEISPVLAETKLSVTTDPNVDPKSEAAKHWSVTTMNPRGDVKAGSDVTLDLESDIERAVQKCSAGKIGDQGASVELDGVPDRAYMNGQYLNGDVSTIDIVCVLTDLNAPDSMYSKIDGTRALDGRVSDSWDGLVAEWTFHPDKGLDVIVEIER